MHEEQDKSPVSFKANVARLPQKGMPVVIEADARQREALAEAHGLVSVERFRAELLVAPWKRNGVKVSGTCRGRHHAGMRGDARADRRRRSSETVEGLFLPEDSKLGRLGFEGGGEILHRCGRPGQSRRPFRATRSTSARLAEEFFGLGIDPYPRKPGAALPDRPDDEAAAQPEGPLQEKLRRLARKD